MFSFLNDMDNYELRMVDRTEIGTLTVSTVYTSDEGYETAIIDQNDVHPVERYQSRELSEAGHQKWVKFCEDENNTVIEKLGWLGLVDSETIILKR